MLEKRMADEYLEDYQLYLRENEKSNLTIKKYVHELMCFFQFLNGDTITKAKILEYREWLQNQNQARTVNAKLSAVHSYLEYTGLSCCKVRFLKIQRNVFMDDERDLNEAEYRRLLEAAKGSKNPRLYYVMVAICGTGIRVSELPFLTVEAVCRGKVEICMKGKTRTVLLTRELLKKLKAYVKVCEIQSGVIFRTRNGKPLDRSNIGHDMKKLCKAARVNPRKVFPHNLRHLFAKSYYAIKKNLANLADILGHSSVETTRIYVATGVREHERTLQKMRLIL